MQSIQTTPVGARLLQILQEKGDWMSRSELSAAYGRTLGMTDFAALDDLKVAGVVEISVGVVGQVKPKYSYRALSE